MTNRTIGRFILAFALGYMLAFAATAFTRANTTMDGLINQSRTANGLSTLATNPVLTDIAMQRAVEIQFDYSHNFWWWDQSGCVGIGENIMYRIPAADNPEQYAHDAFMASEPHRANILGGYTDVGTALLIGDNGGMYAVQLFGNDCGGDSYVPQPPAQPTPPPTPVPVQNPPVGQPAQPTVVPEPVQLPDTSMEKP